MYFVICFAVFRCFSHFFCLSSIIASSYYIFVFFCCIIVKFEGWETLHPLSGLPFEQVPLPSTTPLLQLKSRFTALLTLSPLLVVWRFLTLAPHRLAFDEMFWVTCSRLVQHPSRASRNASLVSGGGFSESGPLTTPTGVRLSVQSFREDSPTCSVAVRACAFPPQ